MVVSQAQARSGSCSGQLQTHLISQHAHRLHPPLPVCPSWQTPLPAPVKSAARSSMPAWSELASCCHKPATGLSPCQSAVGSGFLCRKPEESGRSPSRRVLLLRSEWKWRKVVQRGASGAQLAQAAERRSGGADAATYATLSVGNGPASASLQSCLVLPRSCLVLQLYAQPWYPDLQTLLFVMQFRHDVAAPS